MFGAFAYVGADLHLRFGLSFTAVGLVVGAFGIGGLIYAAIGAARWSTGSARPGSRSAAASLMALAFLTLAVEPVWWFAPLAMPRIGLGFYMLHNTLQTNATQMTPQARGTAVALFSSVFYLGQTVGVALAAPVVDRFGAVPLFVLAAVLLPALALWFARAADRARQR